MVIFLNTNLVSYDNHFHNVDGLNLQFVEL